MSWMQLRIGRQQLHNFHCRRFGWRNATFRYSWFNKKRMDYAVYSRGKRYV